MIDIVTNHMAFIGCGTCVEYSIYNPFNDPSYFHNFCLIDYSDEYSTEIQTCWQGSNSVPLPDLRTEDENVRDIWKNWITQMVDRYGIDGLRIDSVKHIEKDFHSMFEEAAGVFTLGEVYNGDPSYCLDYQHYMSGIANYPLYFWMRRAFGESPGSFYELGNGINTIKSMAVNTSYLGTFIENHDQTRMPSLTSDRALIKNGIAFTIMMDGIPIIWQGQEHLYAGEFVEGRAPIWPSGFDTTTEMYTWIEKLNAIRNHVISFDDGFVAFDTNVIYNFGSTIALRKGQAGNQIVSVYSSAGQNSGSYSITLSATNTGFSPNEELVEVMSCTRIKTTSDATLEATISSGLAAIYYPASKLEESEICSDKNPGSDSDCEFSSVDVTFNTLATTFYGDTIKL